MPPIDAKPRNIVIIDISNLQMESLAALGFSQISISDTAERARTLLTCCQQIDAKKPKSIADAQLGRFDLWTSNIGVFSTRQASLDYRLRTAPEAKAAVGGKLETLCVQLLSGKAKALLHHQHMKPSLTCFKLSLELAISQMKNWTYLEISINEMLQTLD